MGIISGLKMHVLGSDLDQIEKTAVLLLRNRGWKPESERSLTDKDIKNLKKFRKGSPKAYGNLKDLFDNFMKKLERAAKTKGISQRHLDKINIYIKRVGRMELSLR